ncbi:MAG: sulfite exporter TauE/SafE family protein [Alphaproteobacteria bacterium]
MDGFLQLIVPPGLSVLEAMGLMGLSLFTSLLTAMLSVGGGMLLISVMASILPPAALIPVHGMVQLGSNLGRSVLMWRYIDWRFLGWFLAGALIGAALASLWVVTLPGNVLRGLIGAYILWAIWGKPLPFLKMGRGTSLGIGFAATFMAMFVGVAGPLLASLFRQSDYNRKQIVANQATTMSVQHALKGVVFGAAGFAFLPWLGFIAAMIATGFVGTWIGRHLLFKLPEKRFRQALDLVLTLLALRLMWQAFTGG